jgi:hypothetical protein
VRAWLGLRNGQGLRLAAERGPYGGTNRPLAYAAEPSKFPPDSGCPVSEGALPVEPTTESGKAGSIFNRFDSAIRQPTKAGRNQVKSAGSCECAIPIRQKAIVVARILVNRPNAWRDDQEAPTGSNARGRVSQNNRWLERVFKNVENADSSKSSAGPYPLELFARQGKIDNKINAVVRLGINPKRLYSELPRRVADVRHALNPCGTYLKQCSAYKALLLAAEKEIPIFARHQSNQSNIRIGAAHALFCDSASGQDAMTTYSDRAGASLNGPYLPSRLLPAQFLRRR